VRKGFLKKRKKEKRNLLYHPQYDEMDFFKKKKKHFVIKRGEKPTEATYNAAMTGGVSVQRG
jgi:hypothetical protein